MHRSFCGETDSTLTEWGGGEGRQGGGVGGDDPWQQLRVKAADGEITASVF